MKELSQSDRQFLELLKCGLCGTAPREVLFAAGADWPAIRAQARRQAVTAIVCDGLSRLPRGILLEWYGETVGVERRNRHVNGVLADVVARYRSAGLRPVLLKGQGLAECYLSPLHRTPGDIDLYFPEGYRAANAAARAWGHGFEAETVHHQAYSYRGVEVENHRRYVYFYSSRNRRNWARWEREHPLARQGETLSVGGLSVPVPDPASNAIYVLLHLQHHFLNVGVGLRQVCDWARLLAVHGAGIDRRVFAEAIASLPVGRTLPALSYLAVTYLGLPPSACPAIPSAPRAEADGELMLRDILSQGNFGHDTRIMRSFRRGRLWGNAVPYALTLLRHARIYGLCPSEIRAYPLSWLRDKCRGDR